MLVVSVVLGLIIAVDLVSYAVTGEMAYVSLKYGVAASGTAALVINVSMLLASIGLGIIGWRKFRRGGQGA